MLFININNVFSFNKFNIYILLNILILSIFTIIANKYKKIYECFYNLFFI